MKKFGDWVTKHKLLILIVALILLVPSVYGMYKTKINYDILVYLPSDIETVEGQDILKDDFGMGAYSIAIVDNMNAKDVLKLEEKIKDIDGVGNVASLYDMLGTTVPVEMLPHEVTDKLYKDNETLMFITFKDGTSAEGTMNAVKDIRELVGDSVKIGGMSSMVLDTRELSDSEIVAYIIIAVVLCLIVLAISLDSYVIPIILLANIGIAILYNMGTNIFLGNISYITKAISAILQLGVTTDFSIFLYHKYEKAKQSEKDKNKAMSNAIVETITSVVGSSLTTIAGFLALCTMTLTLGSDIGIVMAKGVLFGVIGVVTLFPALILFFDKAITKTHHKPLIPEFKLLKNFIIKHYKVIFVIFLILVIPAWYCQKNTPVYYKLDASLPETLPSQVANSDLKENFGLVNTELLLIDKNLSNNDTNDMIEKIKKLDGIDFVLAASSLSDLNVPESMISDDIKDMLVGDKYKLVLINSSYETASDELNNQIKEVNDIIKEYDDDAILAGEGPLTNDLVTISNIDFTNVTYTSLAVIFVLMLIVLKSYTLPVILVLVIETAIFINMGIPFITGTPIPFIASIVLGTIQLGATIDYAILMTTKYLEERKSGKDKMDAIRISLDNSVSSIFVSGMCFFAATFGVGIYTDIEMIGSITSLISRGAIISMLMVIMVLPSMLLIFDKIICKTTFGFKKKEGNKMKKKIVVAALALAILMPFNASALSKDETVYAKLNSDGTVKNVTVSEHIKNEDKVNELEDITGLSDIKNANGDETFTIDNNTIIFNSNGNDIYYQGTSTDKLPISTKITYTLDGKDIKKEDLIGKEGKVVITIKLTNNEYHNGLYTPFVVALSTTINTKNNSNVDVTNGKVISTGANNVIAAIASPGLYESLDVAMLKDLDTIKISFDTTSFEDNSLYLVATPKLLEDSDLNVFDKLDGIYAKADYLASATKELVTGAQTLNTGLITYQNKFSEYAKAVSQVKYYSNVLTNKYSNIDDGIQMINNGLAQLNSQTGNINAMKTAIDTIASGANTLAAGTASLNNGTEQIITELTNHITALQTIAATTTDPATTTAIDAEITSLTTSINLTALQAQIDGLNTGANTLSTGAGNLKTQTDDSIPLLVNSINDLATGANTLATGSTAYKDSIQTYNANIASLYDATTLLNNATLELATGSTTLSNGVNTYNEQGIKQISSYIGTAKNLTNKLNSLKSLSKAYKSFDKENDKAKNNDTKLIMLVD